MAEALVTRGMNHPSWVFAGAKAQGHAVLEALSQCRHLPSLLVLAPDQAASEEREFRTFAHTHGVPISQSRKLIEHVDQLHGIDLLLLCRFGLIAEPVFSAPRLGAINIHSSLLPEYRGVHPVSWALINGERRTGVTLHRIDTGIDTGDVLKQRSLPIRATDDIWSLTERLNRLSARLAVELFQKIATTGSLPRARRQSGQACYAPRRTPEDGRIDWAKPARAIHDLVRALQPPLPLAFFEGPSGQTVFVHECRVLRRQLATPGAGVVIAVQDDGSSVVATGTTPVLIKADQILVPGQRLQ